jgi:hypothetical protein
MKTWDGGVPGLVANDAETFGLQNLQTEVVGGCCVAPNRGSICEDRPDK